MEKNEINEEKISFSNSEKFIICLVNSNYISPASCVAQSTILDDIDKIVAIIGR
jgi:hypothetical protein